MNYPAPPGTALSPEWQRYLGSFTRGGGTFGYQLPAPTTPMYGDPSASAAGQPIQIPGSPNPPITGVQMAQRDLPTALDIGRQLNDYALNYQRNNIPNYYGNESALSNRIQDFLNPYDPVASYDVAMHGAEAAAGRGLPGGSSGLGGQLTGRLRQADIERRAALGANLMGQEVSWLPKPFDPSKLFVDPNTVYSTQEQEAMERQRLAQQLSIENARLLAEQLNQRRGWGGGGRGGYNFNPLEGTTQRTPAPIASGYKGLPMFSLPSTGQPYASTPPPKYFGGIYDNLGAMSDADAYQQLFGEPYLDFGVPQVDIPDYNFDPTQLEDYYA